MVSLLHLYRREDRIRRFAPAVRSNEEGARRRLEWTEKNSVTVAQTEQFYRRLHTLLQREQKQRANAWRVAELEQIQ